MRLISKEDDVYKLMDRRDLYLGAAGLCGIVSVVLLLFISYGYGNWENLYFLSVLIVGMIFLLYYTWKINQRIMEAERCYLELDEDSLAVYQPEKNGQYEACRIFYQEIEKIVEGSRRGVPEFYVVVHGDENQKSFILLNGEEQMRKIFCVRSLGYRHEEFKEFYRKLRWEVPGKVRIVGTKYQTVWDMKQSHKGWMFFVCAGAVYLILEVCLNLGIL